MAAQDKTPTSATTLGKTLRSGQPYGILTPDATPAPEPNKVQLTAEQPQSRDSGVQTQSKPLFDDTSDAGSEVESGELGRQDTHQPGPASSSIVGKSKKAKTTRSDPTGSDEADHPRLDDIMDIKFESGTPRDRVNTPSDEKAAQLQRKP